MVLRLLDFTYVSLSLVRKINDFLPIKQEFFIKTDFLVKIYSNNENRNLCQKY